MTLREKVLQEFTDWNIEQQKAELNAYKRLGSFSPFTDVDYKLMESVMNNPSAEIKCKDGECDLQPIINAKKEKENNIIIENSANSFWDRKNGIGAVPKQTPRDIAYFGFEATMKASDFLNLAADLPSKDLTYIETQYKKGEQFGFPFLGIDWYGDEEGSRKENKWKVDKHEGRHRVEFFMNEFGDKDIIVSIFTSLYTGELRNRNLRADMFKKGIKLEPQQGAKYEGKRFEISELINDGFVDFKIGE